MIIYEQRGKFKFRDGSGRLRKFATMEEAVEAGGIAPNEQVQVSGVPYKVPASSVASSIDDDDEEGDN